MDVTFTLYNGGVRLNPLPPYAEQWLHYSRRSFETVNYRRVNKFEKRLLYANTPDGAVCPAGCFAVLHRMVVEQGDKPVIQDWREPMPAIDWTAVQAIGLRDYQVEPTAEILDTIATGLGVGTNGIVYATGGYGKSICICALCAAFKGLNTIVAAPLNAVFNDLHKKLCHYFPNRHIGRMGGGSHDISEDITVSTYASLGSCATEKCKLLIMDECQSATGEKIQQTIAEIRPVRAIGLTATDKGTFSNSDKVITAIFGERLIAIEYPEAQELGGVVPMCVYMLNMPELVANYTPHKDLAVSMRRGIYNLTLRNRIISAILKTMPAGWQSLTHVDHVGQVVRLMPFMPSGSGCIHRESSEEEAGAYAMNTRAQKKAIADFQSGVTQHLVATPCLKAGADFVNIRAVVIGSGGCSKINITQKALRGSRIAPGKTHCVIIDFMDRHDDGLLSHSIKRRKIYEAQGWHVDIVDRISQIDWRKCGGQQNLL